MSHYRKSVDSEYEPLVQSMHDELLLQAKADKSVVQPSVDMVNNPPHYKQGGIECIEAIRAALTEDEFRGYCKGNAIKYIWRECHKGGDESIKKGIWYLNKMVEES